jgi:hypothetical protein
MILLYYNKNMQLCSMPHNIYELLFPSEHSVPAKFQQSNPDSAAGTSKGPCFARQRVWQA